MQIRTRLTLQFIILVAGILLLSLVFIHFQFKKMAELEFYDNLRSKALMTAEMVLHDEDKIQPIDQQNTAPIRSRTPLPFRENIIIYNEDLQRVFAFNHDAPVLKEKMLDRLKNTEEQRFEQESLLGIGLWHTSHSGKRYLVYAVSSFSTEDLDKLRTILVITFFLGIGIVAAGGWIYAGRAMAPVARIVDQVDRMLPSDLGARLSANNNHDEISRLVHTFNRLLDRIQVAFKMQKNFISNVSHELKNPLSVIISQLEITLDKTQRPANVYRETLESVLEDTRELHEISEKLLQLARLHSEGGDLSFEWVRLDEAMLQTRAALLKLHPEYHIAFDIIGVPESEEELCVKANEPLLRAALMNLMDNGCKFSPNKKVVAKIFFDSNGSHRVEITDSGPGIPEKDLQMIFQPFYRSPQNIHIKGSGIGLALVDSILKLHQIGLDVVSKKGAGTTFRLSFPTAA